MGKLKSWVKKGAILVISLLLLVLIISFGDLNQIYAHLKEISIFQLLILLALMSLAMLVRAWRWKFFLADESKIPFLRIMPIFFAGKAVTGLTPGNAGEPIRSVFLKQMEGIPVSKSMKSLIVERVIDLLIVLFFSCYVLIFYLQNLIGKLWLGYLFLLILILTALLFLFSRKFSFFILNNLTKLFKRQEKIKHFLDLFINSFCDSTVKKRTFFWGIIISLFIWALDGAVFFIIFTFLGEKINFFFLLSAFSLSVIIGLVSLLPGGLGSLEGGFVLLLVMVGMDKNVAITGALVGRFVNYVYPMFLGYLFFLMLQKHRKKEVLKEAPKEASKST